LQSSRPAAALATARETQAELSRRGTEPTAELKLVEAIALSRIGEQSGGRRDGSPGRRRLRGGNFRSRQFLRGLIADDRGDTSSSSEPKAVIRGTVTQR
jgi:hypothetical protein